jgi:hypothetical protein
MERNIPAKVLGNASTIAAEGLAMEQDTPAVKPENGQKRAWWCRKYFTAYCQYS